MIRCDLFRLIQEALHNVTKHASADSVMLAIHRDDNKLVVMIRDDGCGFDPWDKLDAGSGLYSMQARSERCGGDLQISSGLGKGTTIKVCCPIPEDVKAEGRESTGLPMRRRQADRRSKRERRSQKH